MKFFKTFSSSSQFIDCNCFHFFTKNGVAHVRYNSMSLDKDDVRFACRYYYGLLSANCPNSIDPPFNLEFKSLKTHDLVVYLHGLLCDYAQVSGSFSLISELDGFFVPSLKSFLLPHGVLRSKIGKICYIVSVYDVNRKFLGYLYDDKFYNNRAILSNALSSQYPCSKFNLRIVFDDKLPF